MWWFEQPGIRRLVATVLGACGLLAALAGCGFHPLYGRTNPEVAAQTATIKIGVRQSGDMVKALAAGANSVMIGSLFAGLEESPGETVTWKGRRFKDYRGMGSLGAMVKGSADRYGQSASTVSSKLVPEGIEGRVPFRGPLSDMVYQMVGGLRAGMGYCGAGTVDELRRKARFCRVTAAGIVESHPHDVLITKESPNYAMEIRNE